MCKNPIRGLAARVIIYSIQANDIGQRIDNFLIRFCKGVPKSHLYRLLRCGQVRVNKGRIDPTYRVKEGDLVRLPPMRLATQKDNKKTLLFSAAAFKVVFEDEALLIINKFAGVAVHGGSGISHGVIEQLRAMRPQAKFLELAHRLDRNTSGLLLIAKKRSALNCLQHQMRYSLMDKRYLVLVSGQWKSTVGHHDYHVRLPLHKYTTVKGERQVCVAANGKPSHTIFRWRQTIQAPWGVMSLLEAQLKTGRTHQIRVHLAATGFPVIGDEKYGNFDINRVVQKTMKRMFLHAHEITFQHPITQKWITLYAPLPQACEDFLCVFPMISDNLLG